MISVELRSAAIFVLIFFESTRPSAFCVSDLGGKFLNRASYDTFATFDLFGGAVNTDQNNSFIHRNVLYFIQMETDCTSKEQSIVLNVFMK